MTGLAVRFGGLWARIGSNPVLAETIQDAFLRKGSPAPIAEEHLSEHTLVLYDLTSTYFEGSHCELAQLGHSRDGKSGTPQSCMRRGDTSSQRKLRQEAWVQVSKS